MGEIAHGAKLSQGRAYVVEAGEHAGEGSLHAVAVLAYLFEVYIDNGFARMKWQTALKSGWIVGLVLGVGNVAVLLLI